jgi:hypothetical protein
VPRKSRKLSYEEFHDMYHTQYVISVIRWAGHVAGKTETINIQVYRTGTI